MAKINAVKITKSDHEGDNFGSGLFFKSHCESKSFVLTAKHSICEYTESCESFIDSKINECRTCTKNQSINGLTLIANDHQLTPNGLYISEKQDLALVSVTESALIKLEICNLDKSFEYSFYGFKQSSTRVGRILVGQPEEHDQYASFNIISNPNTELREKSDDFYGLSGSVVLIEESKSINKVYAVVTDNEENNDIGCEVLLDSFNDEVSKFFNCNVFFIGAKKDLIFNNFSDIKQRFNCIHTEMVSNSCNIEVLIPKNLGYPFFNYTSIVQELSESFVRVLGTNLTDESKRTISALNILNKKKNFEPAKKILTSRIVESYLSAPHIYSSTIDCEQYYNLHIRDYNGNPEYIYSCFDGKKDLKANIFSSVNNMFNSINSFSYSLLEKGALDRDFSKQDCENIYKILFSENINKSKSVAILCTFPLTELDVPSDQMTSFVKQTVINIINELKPELIKKTKYDISLYLFILPINFRQEIADLLESEIAKI
jgi:hypothetical protein